MALETRPIPVLKGKVAKEFFERLEKCQESKSKEEVQAINCWVEEILEKSRKKKEKAKND